MKDLINKDNILKTIALNAVETVEAEKMKALAEAEIRSLSHEGRGVATYNNKTVFIDNALMGERVIFQLVKKSRRYDMGKAIKILTPSENRVTPKCAHFLDCGGCALQHMKADVQIIAKQNILLEHLSHFGKVTPEKIDPPLTGPVYGYRRKARLGVRYVRKKEQVLVGFREKHSNKIAEIERCEILHPSVGEKITDLKKLIQSLEAFDAIPQIEVAIGDTETALVFRNLSTLSENDLQKLIQFAKETSFILFLQPKGPESIYPLWPKEHSGFLHYKLPEYSLTYHFRPDDFTQVNADINQAMVKKAIELMSPASEDIILDLFCGLGNFTLPMARFAKTVVGVEGSAAMVARAEYNAKQNGINNVHFLSANLEEEGCLKPVFDRNMSQTSFFNKVLLDPPRTGAYTIVQALAAMKHIKSIVYVSCNPATLARDVGVLVHQGTFRLKSVQVMDMFPHTAHVESMALLVR